MTRRASDGATDADAKKDAAAAPASDETALELKRQLHELQVENKEMRLRLDTASTDELEQRGERDAKAAGDTSAAEAAGAGGRPRKPNAKKKSSARPKGKSSDPPADDSPPDSDDQSDGGDGGGGGGGEPRSGRGRAAPGGDGDDSGDGLSEEDLLDDGDEDALFGEDTLERPDPTERRGKFDGQRLGCEYDESNQYPRTPHALRQRTSHYRAADAGDPINAAIQDKRTPDGKYALSMGSRTELCTLIPALSYLYDLDSTLTNFIKTVRESGEQGELAELTITVAGMCTQQVRAIGDFMRERFDEIEQLSLNDKTTLAQFQPLYVAQRLRSQLGTSLREQGLFAQQRALTNIAARERARAAAGATPGGPGTGRPSGKRGAAARLAAAAAATSTPQAPPAGAKADGARGKGDGRGKGGKGGDGGGRGGGK